ncbi:MAG: UDP-N-acetyl glucosamine 2-epimerase, partial [Aquificae bacterium]|nr:UDP-N-acetyl glucosamine 2-epimerase [Aquificota bacterium]
MKIFVVFGTRPEAIKLAPVIHRLKGEYNLKVISSGQHKELVEPVIRFFNIQPDIELEGGSKDRTLSQFGAFLLENLDGVLREEKPDLVVVQGDTMTAFISTFAAYLNKIPVAHVEAGLRTY